MRRKIFICFFVVLLMTTMVVPAFATSSGGSGSSYISPAVVISNIKLLNGPFAGSVVDWPNNYASSNGIFASGDMGVLGFSSGLDGDKFDTTIFPGAASSIQLNIADFFWTEDLYFGVDDDGYESAYITSVSVSGNIITVNKSGGEFATHTGFFSGNFAVNSYGCNLAKAVRDAVGNIEAYGDLVFLQNVSITIKYYAVDPDAPVRLHFSVSKAKFSDPYISWFNSRHLTQQVIVQGGGPNNMFQWLLDSVNAFLNFEIVPGLSLNRIFYIVLVIGVLLWFITLLI